MAWAILLFGFGGRTNRAKFWLAWLIFFVIYMPFAIATSLTDSPSLSAMSSMITIVLFVSGLAVCVKRLQDRNKSGWYVLLFFVAPVALSLAGMSLGLTDGLTFVAQGLWLVGSVISIWGLVELGFIRGTIGANRFGPDPLAPKPAHH
jgi:uncharacterized membrane protein YhaH (DUF805 family)